MSVKVSGAATRADFHPQCIMIAFRAGPFNFLPTFVHVVSTLLAFRLGEAVKLMNSSVSFKHTATKVKKQKLIDMFSCSSIFKLKFLFQSFCMLACTQTP